MEHWTDEAPTKPGMYWYWNNQEPATEELRPVLLKIGYGCEVLNVRDLHCSAEKSWLDEQGMAVSENLVGEWHGPIEPPPPSDRWCHKQWR